MLKLLVILPWMYICFLSTSVSEIVEFGNPPSLSTQTLPSTQDMSFILSDYTLINGTLRQFKFTTSNRITAVQLQLWRPTGGFKYILMNQTKFVSTTGGNYYVYPGEDVVVQDGDKLGFMSETSESGIVYDFRPKAPGSTTLTRLFHSLPVMQRAYTFNQGAYDTWVFALSVKIDTAYGVGPLDQGTTVDTTTPHLTTTVRTTRRSPYTIHHIGNPLLSGFSSPDNMTSGTFLLSDIALLYGYIIAFHVNVPPGEDSIVLQLWRPRRSGEYTLIYQELFYLNRTGNSTVLPDTAILVETDDRLGFTVLPGSRGISYVISPQQTLYLPGDNETAIFTGENYNFTQVFQNYTFSLAVDIDTDVYKYRQIPSPPYAVTSSELSPAYLAMLLIIVIVYVLIATIATIYALWYMHSRHRKVYLVKKDYHLYSVPEVEVTIPRDNIYLYEALSDTNTCTIIKAQVFGIGAKPGWSTCAVRVLKATASDQEKHTFLREMAVMRGLKSHPNVITFLGCCVEKDPMMMITEAVPFGNLLDYLRQLKDTNIRLNIAGHTNFTLTMDLLAFSTQVARGMAFLSAQRILCHDLAARNILLGEGKLCKVSYFGHAQHVVESRQYERAIKNPLPVRWMAPESLMSNIFTNKSDVWSFGVLLWEIVTLGATPYYEMEATKLVKCVRKGVRLPQPPHCRQELYSLMFECWRQKPHDRPAFESLEMSLQTLHDENRDMLQLEKYPDELYSYVKPTQEEIV